MAETPSPPLDRDSLSPIDMQVLRILLESSGRVIGREFIARQTGIESSASRRVDASLVAIRRAIGADSIVTVRSRGWMLTTAGEASARSLLS